MTNFKQSIFILIKAHTTYISARLNKIFINVHIGERPVTGEQLSSLRLKLVDLQNVFFAKSKKQRFFGRTVSGKRDHSLNGTITYQ